MASTSDKESSPAHQSAEAAREELLAGDTISPDTDWESGNPLIKNRPSLEPGHLLKGRYSYELQRRLGTGGFGSVFEAFCLDTLNSDCDGPPQRVAIKVFHTVDTQRATTFLKRELSSLLAMKHPRIPRVYDWQMMDTMAFMVIHYYSHGSLNELRSLLGRMENEMAWRLLTDLSSAATAAHAASILHLDIKPANVLVDDDGGFVLTDFGISQGNLVPWHMIDPGLGTRGYQAPEQRNLDEKAIDVRTDLWGIGSTIWSLYTGINLVKHRDVFLQTGHAVEFGLPPMSDYRPNCDPQFEEIVMSLLRVNPDERPGGAAEVLAKINRLRGDGSLSEMAAAVAEASPITEEELNALIKSMMDPLWVNMCRNPEFQQHIVHFDNGMEICHEGDPSHVAYVILQGSIEIERRGRILDVEEREGAFVGEISTLTGEFRTATLRARGQVYACTFNAAQLERLVTMNPAIGVRLMKSMAQRLTRESQRRSRSD